jgi:hypothetical protein
MIPHILLLWTMAISPVTETEHGGWRYLGTYDSADACANSWMILSRYEYHIFGKFMCVPQGPEREPVPAKPVVRF